MKQQRNYNYDIVDYKPKRNTSLTYNKDNKMHIEDDKNVDVDNDKAVEYDNEEAYDNRLDDKDNIGNMKDNYQTDNYNNNQNRQQRRCCWCGKFLHKSSVYYWIPHMKFRNRGICFFCVTNLIRKVAGSMLYTLKGQNSPDNNR